MYICFWDGRTVQLTNRQPYHSMNGGHDNDDYYDGDGGGGGRRSKYIGTFGLEYKKEARPRPTKIDRIFCL